MEGGRQILCLFFFFFFFFCAFDCGDELLSRAGPWLLIAVSQLWGALFQKVSPAGDTVTPHIWDIYNKDCPQHHRNS
jgi:hypothetical protein